MEKPEFAPSFFEELAQDNPLGITISAAEAEAWWNWIAWPRYKTYGYKRHKVAVRRWWAGITISDLKRTVEAMGRAEIEYAMEYQAKLDEYDEEDRRNPHGHMTADSLTVIMGGKS